MSHVSDPAVMRWFSDEWHGGELSDTDVEAVVVAYDAHVRQLRDRVPGPVWELTQLNLHDGQVQSWEFENDRFAWTLLIGDLQRGYELATIVYADAELIGVDRTPLSGSGLERDAAELLSDEVDAVDGRHEHRFYFWPGHVFGVRFSDVTVSLVPASGDLRRPYAGRTRWSRFVSRLLRRQ